MGRREQNQGRVSARCDADTDGSFYSRESSSGPEGAPADPAVYAAVCSSEKQDRLKPLLYSQKTLYKATVGP